ncbi:Allergen V5/Tpx-1 related [Bacillus altitudinis]|nr:Allergen V5/Tpx-1 related [Bacillus altitudinis]
MKTVLKTLFILLIISGTYVLFIQYGSSPEKENSNEPKVSNEETSSDKPINIPKKRAHVLYGEVFKRSA